MGKRYSFTKSSLSLLLVISMFLSNIGLAVANSSDIKGHWAEKELQEWIDTGKMAGFDDGTIKPNKTVTRAEFMAFVNRGFGFNEEGTPVFKDVKSSDWYYSVVAKAVAAGYISGYEDETIRPNNTISRQEAASIITRLAALEAGSVDLTKTFDDAGKIPSWSESSIKSVVSAGLMKGFEDDTFRPLKNMTRAEAVVTIDRVLSLSAKETVATKSINSAGTYGPSSIENKETINGNVEVNAQDVTIQNTIINGDLYINEEVGDGEVYLQNVTVKGETKIYGGGENSIYFTDSELGTVFVEKEDGKIRIVAKGYTTIEEVIAASGVKIEEQNITGSGVKNITIDAPDNSDITLAGEFLNVIVNNAVQLHLATETVINNAEFNAAADVTGQGAIKVAKLFVNGVTFEKQPDQTSNEISSSSDDDDDSSSGGSSNSSDQVVSQINNQLQNAFDSDPTLDSSVKLSALSFEGFTGDTSQINLEPVNSNDVSLFGSTGSRAIPGLTGSVFEFTTGGQTFNSATLTFDVSSVTQVQDLSKLQAVYYNETTSEFEFLPTTVDSNSKTVSFTTTHNSKYLLIDTDEWERNWRKDLQVDNNVSSQYVDFAFIIDSSGSMTYTDPQDLRKQAASQLVTAAVYDANGPTETQTVTVNGNDVSVNVYVYSDRFAVIDFDSSATVVSTFTAHQQTVKDAVYSIDSWGGTDYFAGIDRAISAYDSVYNSVYNIDNRKIAILLTDGQNNYPATESNWQRVQDAVTKGITIITVGLGNSLDHVNLKEIASKTGGQYYQISTASELSQLFTNIKTASDLSKDTDGDGLKDWEEVTGLRLKNGMIVYTDPNNADTDGDGVNDNVELGNIVAITFTTQNAPANSTLIGQTLKAYEGLSLPDNPNSN